MRELENSLAIRTALAPAVLSADTNGVTIDRLGFESVLFSLHVGVGGITFTGTNRVDFVMQHSDDGTNWSAVAADDVVGVTVAAGGIVRSLIAAHAAATVTKASYVGGRRYTRLNPDFGGTHATGTPMSAVAILGHASDRPVA